MKKLPPYAKAIADARRKGLVPARGDMGHIAIGFEWRRNIVPDFPVVVIPPGRDPGEFNWQFVAGLDVFIMHRDRDIPSLHSLCAALFSASATDVQTFNIDRVCRGEKRAWLRLTIQPGASSPWYTRLWEKVKCKNQN